MSIGENFFKIIANYGQSILFCLALLLASGISCSPSFITVHNSRLIPRIIYYCAFRLLSYHNKTRLAPSWLCKKRSVHCIKAYIYLLCSRKVISSFLFLALISLLFNCIYGEDINFPTIQLNRSNVTLSGHILRNRNTRHKSCWRYCCCCCRCCSRSRS